MMMEIINVQISSVCFKEHWFPNFHIVTPHLRQHKTLLAVVAGGLRPCVNMMCKA